MKLSFKVRGKVTTLARLDGVVALQPGETVRSAASTQPRIAGHFKTTTADDDSRGGRFGIELPAKNRKLFEKAGWLFVEPREPLTKAAERRSTLTGAEAVRPVFMDEAGATMIGTELLTVQLPEEMTEAQTKQVLQVAKLRLVRRLGFAPNLLEVRLPPGEPFPEVLSRLQQDQHFVFAEPAFLEPVGGRAKPVALDYHKQWQHTNDGSSGGQQGADIRSEAAWDLTRGAGVRIAVIDNGMQVDHPGLKAGVVASGYFHSDLQGSSTFVRFGLGDKDFPGSNHGTFCMGMAGARWSNKRGGCGSAPEASLMPVACLQDQVGTQTTLARAIAYAADPTTEDAKANTGSGAEVIACSLGPNSSQWNMTSVLDLAIRAAAAKGRGGRGVPIFWAVSNAPVKVELDEVCCHPDIIAVGRSNRNDQEDGSAYGDKLEFLAPGRDVYSTQRRGRYGFDTGTSYACPLAAGIAALVIARYPSWSRDQVRERLRESCDKVGGVTYTNGRHSEYGYGRINARQAVQ